MREELDSEGDKRNSMPELIEHDIVDLRLSMHDDHPVVIKLKTAKNDSINLNFNKNNAAILAYLLIQRIEKIPS